jgi:hypothetical protein
MSANPQLMQNMLQAPYMQSMMEAMSANPELANQVNIVTCTLCTFDVVLLETLAFTR